MESMKADQLSIIALYSVCKIQNLNTELPWSVDVGIFNTESLLSVEDHVRLLIFLSVFKGLR